MLRLVARGGRRLGGTTASVAALIYGRTLVYAMSGDSSSIYAAPPELGAGKSAPLRVEELIPEHSPTNLAEWCVRARARAAT